MESAANLFAAEGYVRTTLAKIAVAAGVSAETVQGHGPKAALLIAALEYVGVGVSGEENILNLDIGRNLIAIDDARESVDLVASVVTDVHERTAKLAPALFSGASCDPELDQYLTGFIAGINRQVRRVLDVYRDRGWLRDDVPLECRRLSTMVPAYAGRSYFRCTAGTLNPT